MSSLQGIGIEELHYAWQCCDLSIRFPTGEELNQLQNVLREFTCELSQVQSQLESVQREKSVLQSKAIEMERMHVQMKDHMGTDINYLRQLNLQLVEQQMKGKYMSVS